MTATEQPKKSTSAKMAIEDKDFAKVARNAIFALPQKNQISPADVDTWLADVMPRMTCFEVISHIGNARGFVGHEISYLMKHSRGEYTSTTSARNIILEKLFRKLPDADSKAALRARRAEADMRDRLTKQFGPLGIERNAAALSATRNKTHSSKRWLIGNLDDYVTLGNVPGQTRNMIVDYKVPSAEHAEKYRYPEKGGAPFAWPAQLHHHDLLCMDKGFTADGLMAFMWDADAYEAVPIEFDRNPALHEEILEVGDHYFFDYLLKGRLPEPIQRFQYSVKDKPLSDEIKEIAAAFTRNKAMEAAARKRADDANKRLRTLLMEDGQVQERRFGVDMLTVDAKEVCDDDGLISLANTLRIDVGDCMNPTDDYDYEAMLAATIGAGGDPELYRRKRLDRSALRRKIEELGSDPAPFFEQSFAVSLPNSITGNTAEAYAEIRAVAEEALNGAEETLRRVAGNEAVQAVGLNHKI
jgi:hypothetical protein